MSERRPRRGLAPVWWTLPLLVLTTATLVLLAWALLVMHGMTYGIFEVLRPQARALPPEFRRYDSALLVGVTVNVVLALALAWSAGRTRARGWPPIAVAALAAVLSLTVAGSVLLLMLGISPVTFLVTLF
ncbi:hypothetical protein [Ornithinimicrobium cryptoxanthini]|uniref:Uncharacterized protein n=1 Tax=Ornithinimicrobium cryptoxanthini TaxID=2934161 RepID=A0ABY4YLQ9_9MICO|nr:hypothetical protein [Ornithinimicrobium cryptoxanthini]USQ77624.1 hypothetical protein NF557_06890 [Ornithinimicrobium cryptoxanthini]